MKRYVCSVILAAAMAISPCASAVSVKITIANAEVVIPEVEPMPSIEAVQSSLSGWFGSAPMSLKPIPNPLPARPGKPGVERGVVGGTPMEILDCPSAAAEIRRETTASRNQMSYNGDFFQACVYPFAKGTKVYYRAVNFDAADSEITHGLFSGIAKSIRGAPGERLVKRLNDMIEKLREKTSKVLVERMEAPGVPLQQPDLVEIQALIPSEPELSVASPEVAAMPAVVTAPATGSPAAMIEARKSLHAMGITYHSQEQFHDAIRRKDDLAVRLFLDAGGIDPKAKDAQGRNAADLAREAGASNVVPMLETDHRHTASVQEPAPVIAPPMSQEEQVKRMRELIRQQMRRQMQ